MSFHSFPSLLSLLTQPASSHRLTRRLGALSLLAITASGAAGAGTFDHSEFEAALQVPFKANPDTRTGNESRYFTLHFDFPRVAHEQAVMWRLELLSPDGHLVQRWYGIESLFKQPIEAKVLWNGRYNKASLPDGLYQVRMQASTVDASPATRRNGAPDQLVESVFASAPNDVIKQSWTTQVGNVAAPVMPKFTALAAHASAAAKVTAAKLSRSVPASGALPYTVYLGNLHSQTNHSDGGGNVATCSSSLPAQSGAFGPADAFTYAMGHGLDYLMVSEHNHYFDGSSSTNTAANATTAKNLYQSGLTAAAASNTAHPNFLAQYGLEWGVINNGGHLNIFGSKELLGWEYNSSNQLIGDTFTAKGDYSALYTLMRSRDWVGQFNHPSDTTQFIVGGVDFGYTADGDQVMAMCEVLDTNAFSSSVTEGETMVMSYESACNKILEAGFHVALTTNQDNHCANWGASAPNRTALLVPNGVPLTPASFTEALKARRMFATMDKNSQLILTANGHLMGERFNNTGPLTLLANFANNTGRTAASVLVYEGVPGRNGTVTQLSNTASTTITPANGVHFYYAKVTQDDGKILWSSPVWVTQSSTTPGDTTAPTVSASVTGTSGTISLAASASDNVGVTRVEFYIDNVLNSTVSAAPYTAAVNSTTLANGSHTLTAKAYDAAGNAGTSTAVNFSINNTVADTTPPVVSASESGSSGNITLSATASDNVGVARVDFYVDNVLKGSASAAPYTLTLNSTTLTNASHSLSAKAYDAANNVGTSSAVSFSVNNSLASQLIVNGGFESAAASWVATSGVITASTTQAARTGTYKAKLDGYGATHTDSLYQQVTIPAAISSASLSFWLKVVSSETTTTKVYDTLKLQVRNSSGAVLATLATYSNLDKGANYINKIVDLSAYKGQTVRIYFEGIEGSQVITTFLIDDVSLTAQ
jgi:hypothetical protein